MDEGSDSEEGLHDSLDDNGVQDSGVGSSSEKAYRVIEYILSRTAIQGGSRGFHLFRNFSKILKCR